MNDLVVKAPALRVYNWTSDEFVLLDWYNNLIASGDHFTTFDRDLRYVSNFLAFFKPPNTLAFASDRAGMWFAYWIAPYLSGATMGLWVREEKRGSKAMFELLIQCIDQTFKIATVILVVTKQESVGGDFVKLGATFGMTIPALWDGEDTAVYTLTRDAWEARHHVRTIRRRQ